MLPSLILAAFIDAEQDNARRGRLHELRGRLGLREAKGKSGLYTRLAGTLSKEVKPGIDQVIAYGWLQRYLSPRGFGPGSPRDGQRQEDRQAVSELADTLRHSRVSIAEHRDRFRRHVQDAEERARQGIPPRPGDPQDRLRRSLAVHIEREHDRQRRAELAATTETGLSFLRFTVPLNEAWLVKRDQSRHPVEPYLSWVVREWVRAWHGDDEESDRTVREIDGLSAVSLIIDWANQEEGIDIGSLTWSDAKAYSDEWHEAFSRTVCFREPIADGVVVARFADGKTIHRLVTEQHLEDEGESMGHCSGSYWRAVRRNTSHIYSLRGPDRVPLATCELVGEGHQEVAQVMGPLNVPIVLGSAEYIYMRWFLGQMGLALDGTPPLSETFRALTVSRAPMDPPSGYLKSSAELQKVYPGLSLDEADLVKSWWSLEEYGFSLEMALRDETQAHTEDFSEDDMRLNLEEIGEDPGDWTFDGWLRSYQATTEAWAQDAARCFHKVVEDEMEELAYHLQMSAKKNLGKSGNQGTQWLMVWDLKAGGDTPFDVQIEVDSYDGERSYGVRTWTGDRMETIARSERSISDAAIQARLLVFETDIEEQEDALGGEILLPDALDVPILDVIETARVHGHPIDYHMRRLIRRRLED